MVAVFVSLEEIVTVNLSGYKWQPYYNMKQGKCKMVQELQNRSFAGHTYHVKLAPFSDKLNKGANFYQL
jgi:hypothetical protein